MVAARRARFLSAFVLGMAFSVPGAAQPLTKLVFTTNWYAQAEHGGFYQAVAEGIYRKHGLDVEIRMGGPQSTGSRSWLRGKRTSSWGMTSRPRRPWRRDFRW